MTSRGDWSSEATLHKPMSGRTPPLASVIVVSVVGALIWLRWGVIRKGIWIDLDAYVRGAAAMLHHEPLSSVSVQGQVFNYPPFAALMFVPLALLGNIDARWVLTAVSLLTAMRTAQKWTYPS